jgi:hypothetical protein
VCIHRGFDESSQRSLEKSKIARIYGNTMVDSCGGGGRGFDVLLLPGFGPI